MCPRKDLGARGVCVGRDAVVAQRGVDHAPLLVEHHPFVQRPADRLRDRALNLAAALHGVDHRTGVRRVDTLQDADLAGNTVNRDTEALYVERDAAGGAVRLADDFELLAGHAGRGEEIG